MAHDTNLLSAVQDFIRETAKATERVTSVDEPTAPLPAMAQRLVEEHSR